MSETEQHTGEHTEDVAREDYDAAVGVLAGDSFNTGSQSDKQARGDAVGVVTAYVDGLEADRAVVDSSDKAADEARHELELERAKNRDLTAELESARHELAGRPDVDQSDEDAARAAVKADETEHNDEPAKRDDVMRDSSGTAFAL